MKASLISEETIMAVSLGVIIVLALKIYHNPKNEWNSHFSEVRDSFSNTIFSRYDYLVGYVSLYHKSIRLKADILYFCFK
jgi:uncharacterized protein YutD